MEDLKRSTVIKIGAAVLGLIFLIVLFVNSFTRVDPGYGGVQYSMIGGLKKEVLAEGGHLHWPWINVTEYPVSTETVALRYKKSEKGDTSLQVNTNGGKSVAADVRYAYKFESDRLPEIFKRFRRQDAEWISDNYIKQIILDTLQAQTTQHSVLEVYSQNRTEIATTTRDQLREMLAEDGIILEKFTITDIRLDEKTKKILQQVTDAENQKEVLKREQENLKEQEKNITQQKLNEKLAAEGDKETARVNAERQAEKILIEAAALAEANRKLQESLTPELVQYEWIKKWDGVQPTVQTGSGGSMIQLPSSLLESSEKKK